MKGDRQLCMAAVAQLASEEMKGGDRKLCMTARHRYVDRDGIVTGGGSPRCQNRARGGEGDGHALPPPFLYVITGGNYGWHP